MQLGRLVLVQRSRCRGCASAPVLQLVLPRILATCKQSSQSSRCTMGRRLYWEPPACVLAAPSADGLCFMTWNVACTYSL